MNTRQIILDTETTGLYPNSGDRMVEFAGLEMVNRQLTANTLHLYIHPERDIPEEAAAVHGITLAQLEEKNAPNFAGVGRQIAEFLRGAELIIHNAKFDVGFLDMEFGRMGLPTVEELGCTVTDTLGMAREMFPGQKVSLDALCTRFDVDRSKRVFHGALIDCELLSVSGDDARPVRPDGRQRGRRASGRRFGSALPTPGLFESNGCRCRRVVGARSLSRRLG